MRNITATATFDGRWWVFVIDGLATVGQSRRRSDVAGDARDIAALWRNVQRGAIHVGRIRYRRVHWSTIMPDDD